VPAFSQKEGPRGWYYPLVLLRGVAVCLTSAVVSAEFMHRVFRNKLTVSLSLYLQMAGTDRFWNSCSVLTEVCYVTVTYIAVGW
jgi:hypothetical protein